MDDVIVATGDEYEVSFSFQAFILLLKYLIQSSFLLILHNSLFCQQQIFTASSTYLTRNNTRFMYNIPQTFTRGLAWDVSLPNPETQLAYCNYYGKC